MRARGAKVTDIAVLVVAADDGVKPQTQESIAHARAAEVPIVVAVNKIDKPDADPQRVRQELVDEELQPEEWGGSTQYSDVSAREKQNLDDLLEKVLLVADAELELKANPNAEASGPIIESRLDVGRGPVATMLVQRGTLRVGDAIVAGDAWGKVRALHTYRGEKVDEARPGDPIEIIGFDKPPAAGEFAPGRRERAPGAPSRAGPRRAGPARAAGPAAHVRRLAGLALLPDAGGRGPGPQPRDQGRRGRLGRGRRQRAAEDPAPGGARERHPHGRRRDLRERRDARDGVDRDDRRLQRPAERRGAGAGRARGRRDPHLQRHLPADRGHRAGARRHAEAGHDRGDARRGRGARAVPRLAARDDRRLVWSRAASCAGTRRCASSATGRSSTTRRSRSSSASRTTSARSRRASSAASCSTASTT